jgi:hypothetical protein
MFLDTQLDRYHVMRIAALDIRSLVQGSLRLSVINIGTEGVQSGLAGVTQKFIDVEQLLDALKERIVIVRDTVQGPRFGKRGNDNRSDSSASGPQPSGSYGVWTRFLFATCFVVSPSAQVGLVESDNQHSVSPIGRRPHDPRDPFLQESIGGSQPVFLAGVGAFARIVVRIIAEIRCNKGKVRRCLGLVQVGLKLFKGSVTASDRR